MGWLGVDRMVQTGNCLGVGFGRQSKHSVWSCRMRQELSASDSVQFRAPSYFDDRLYLTKVTSSSALNKGDIGGKAHPIDMPSRV